MILKLTHRLARLTQLAIMAIMLCTSPALADDGTESRFAAILEQCSEQSPPSDAFQSVKEIQQQIECVSKAIEALIDKECRKPKNGPTTSPELERQRAEVCAQADQIKQRDQAARTLLELSPPPPDTTVVIKGEQFKWLYTYRLADSRDNSPANEPKCTLDGPLVLAQGQPVELLLTSNDVIHDWRVPSLKIAATGIPGRLSAVKIDTSQPGNHIGTASPQSGSGHAKMNIEVRILPQDEYAEWKRATLLSKDC